METELVKNKEVVKRFNNEVIEQCNYESFKELMNENFINHSAPEGIDKGTEGMFNTFKNFLKPAFPDLKVTIFTQLAEGDLVTTHKAITGTHDGNFMSIEPTGQKISIEVIDIVRIKNGKYFEHWGLTNLHDVVGKLSTKK